MAVPQIHIVGSPRRPISAPATFWNRSLSGDAKRRIKLRMKAKELEEKLSKLAAPLNVDLLLVALRRGRFIGSGFRGEALPKLMPDTVAEYEKSLRADLSPVSIIEDGDGETSLSARELGNPHVLYLAIDLAYPQDVLAELIDQSLRKAISDRSAVIKRNPGKRQRADKADFGIKVYDQVMAGATFQKIAAGLGQPISSVKSAFGAACRDIGIRRPRKRLAPLAAFTLDEDHFKTCKICKHAQTPEDFCAPWRAHALQDQVSQRERPMGRKPRRSFGQSYARKS